VTTLLDSRALRIRHNAAMDQVGYTSTIDERESLLAAVVWPRPPLLAASLQAAIASLEREPRQPTVAA